MPAADRRLLLVAVLTGCLFGARALWAQSPKTPIAIGWLEGGSRTSNGHRLAAFKEGMTALGWKEGMQYVIEERWAQVSRGRLRRSPWSSRRKSLR